MSAVFIAELDAEELAVRLMSRAISMKKPPTEKRSNTQILDDVASTWFEMTGDHFPFRDMAILSIDYFRECMERGARPS